MYILFLLMQEVTQVELTDFLSDSVLGVVVIERGISRFQSWIKDRDMERQEQREAAAKILTKENEDKRIDAIDRKLNRLEGRLDGLTNNS